MVVLTDARQIDRRLLDLVARAAVNGQRLTRDIIE